MSAPLDILAIMAHPDDAELLCGGALIKAGDLGQRVGVVDLTRGELGSAGTPDLRVEEATLAAEVMQLCVRRNAGLPDAAIRNTLEAQRVVVGLIRELRPRVVVTHWINGRHPDHRQAAQLVYDSAFLAGLKNFDAPVASAGPGGTAGTGGHAEAFRPLKVVHALMYREDAPEPSFVIDITGQMDRKIDAIRCYGSQFAGLSQAGEVFPAGDRDLFDQIRVHAGVAGSRIRAAYGEPYWTRETVEVESLGGLEVSTF